MSSVLAIEWPLTYGVPQIMSVLAIEWPLIYGVPHIMSVLAVESPQAYVLPQIKLRFIFRFYNVASLSRIASASFQSNNLSQTFSAE